MNYIINYDVDNEPTVRHAFVGETNAVPWGAVQQELQEHYARHGSPVDVMYWVEVKPDDYFTN